MNEALMLVSDLDDVTQIVNNLHDRPGRPASKIQGHEPTCPIMRAAEIRKPSCQRSTPDARAACRWAWPPVMVLPLRLRISKIRASSSARRE